MDFQFLGTGIVQRWLLMALSVVAVTGCAAVGPDYRSPEVSVQRTWNTSLTGSFSAGEMDAQTLAAWWTRLNALCLTTLSNGR